MSALQAYGGLRGAVAFAMIALLEDNKFIENLKLFKTTTFVLILFTVFVLVSFIIYHYVCVSFVS